MTPGIVTKPEAAIGSLLAALCLLVTLCGCVTTYEDAPLPQPVRDPVPLAVPFAIPLPKVPGGADQVLVAFYAGIMQRMRQAARDRDVAHLEFLLEGYDRRDLPPFLQEQLRGYRAVAKGLRFENHAIEHASLSLVPGPGAAVAGAAPAPAVPPCGEALRFELVLPPGAATFVLGGREDADPIGFSVTVTIDDIYVDGSSRSSRTEDFIRLPATFTLAGDQELRLPLAIDAEAGGSLQRTVHMRVDLWPGYVTVDGVRAPIQRTAIGACTLTQWPKGYEALQQAPLQALENALRTFDESRFAVVFLASALTRGQDREKAMELLIEKVRFARADRAQVAMAALRAISGQTWAVGDREAWLAWWQARR
ncbi:MAG TPA: hypothetical protein VF384_09530 [Planctomycetota bacterium]